MRHRASRFSTPAAPAAQRRRLVRQCAERFDWESGRMYLADLVAGLKRKPWAELEQLPAYVELLPGDD
jgi:hypothetical protein